MKVDVSTLVQDLATSYPAVNNAAVAMNQALLVVAYILLSIFLLLELLEVNQVSGQTGMKIPMKFWMELAMKYVATFVLVTYSSQILDGIMWLLNAGASQISNTVDFKDYSYQFQIGNVKGVAKIILNLIGGTIDVVANLVIFIINFMRYFELYFLKSIAPVLLTCLINQTLRSIAITFLKYFASYVLIALALTVITVLYPVFNGGNYLLATVGSSVAYGAAILSMLQGIIYIVIIVGVTRKMQRLLGV